MEIQNENYLTAVETLLVKYSSTKDNNHLETIHNILSKPQISFRFSDDSFTQINKTLYAKGFPNLIKENVINEVGIAEFPVVGENNIYSAIRTIVAKDGNNNIEIDEMINNKKELYESIRFIQNEIQKYLCDLDGSTRDITILNWGQSFNIREHLLKGTKYEPENHNISINGTSLHFAAVAASVSKILNLPINPDYIFTGAFNSNGEAQRISGLEQKSNLISKERPNTKKIFIPPKSKFNKKEQRIISLSDKFVEIENVSQLIEKVFDKKLQDLTMFVLEARKKLGRARIWAEHVGNKEIIFSKDYETIIETRNCIILHFVRPDDDITAFKIFPINKVYHEFNKKFDFITFEGAVANHYTGQLMTSNDYRQSDSIFGVRLGRSPEVLVFAAPRGSNLLGYKCNFF